MDYQAIAKQFLDAYYNTMSTNKDQLINFYNAESCMTYEGDSFKGVNAIKEKLASMSYTSVNSSLI